jgi:hypothetical protein
MAAFRPGVPKKTESAVLPLTSGIQDVLEENCLTCLTWTYVQYAGLGLVELCSLGGRHYITRSPVTSPSERFD